MVPGEGQPGGDDFDLRASLAVLRRRRWLILGVIVAIAAVAAIVSFSRDKVYSAEAELLIRSQAPESVLPDQPNVGQLDAERQLNNEIRTLESGALRAAAEAVYDGPLDLRDIDVGVGAESSDVVVVSIDAEDPNVAADAVNIYVDTYVEFRLAERTSELLEAGAAVQTELDDVTADLEAARAPLTEVDAELADDPDDEALLARRDRVAAEVAAAVAPLESRQEFYQQQLERLELTRRLAAGAAAQVLTEAVPETDPVAPQPARDIGVALAVGVVLAIALAFLLDLLDERVRSAPELQRIAGALPVVAIIPEAQGNGAQKTRIAVRDQPQSHTAEAYRVLRTSLLFLAVNRDIKTVQVTSPLPGEGKTTVVGNLAMSLAQGGKRVAIVDCDLRRPRVHELFGIPSAPGLTDVILGEARLSEAFRSVHHGIWLLTAGTLPPNPTDVVSSAKTKNILDALVAQSDFVLIDSPPVIPVSDALVIAGHVDAVLVVSDARSTGRRQLQRALDQLAQVEAPTLGAVLNGAAEDGTPYSYGYYSHTNGQKQASAGGRHRRRKAGATTAG